MTGAPGFLLPFLQGKLGLMRPAKREGQLIVQVTQATCFYPKIDAKAFTFLDKKCLALSRN